MNLNYFLLISLFFFSLLFIWFKNLKLFLAKSYVFFWRSQGPSSEIDLLFFLVLKRTKLVGIIIYLIILKQQKNQGYALPCGEGVGEIISLFIYKQMYAEGENLNTAFFTSKDFQMLLPNWYFHKLAYTVGIN